MSRFNGYSTIVSPKARFFSEQQRRLELQYSRYYNGDGSGRSTDYTGCYAVPDGNRYVVFSASGIVLGTHDAVDD